jgi:hypothetical protein
MDAKLGGENAHEIHMQSVAWNMSALAIHRHIIESQKKEEKVLRRSFVCSLSLAVIVEY